MWKLQENVLNNEDIETLKNFINTTSRFTQFEEVKKFEENWSKWQGCKYSVFVNSGSSANLVMLDAIKEYYKIQDDSEVLVPAVTWTTNITPVIQIGLKPVFVDINLFDLSFDYSKLEQAITDKTKIILLTHLIGIPANIDKIKNIAKKHNLIILEDCCESHGAKYKEEKVGNFGLVSTFSFYWGHHMTSVEGGMVCTDDEDLRDLFLLKRSHGLARELPKDKHQKFKDLYPDVDFNFLFLTNGYNLRNTEFNAVLGMAQLKKLDDYILKRNENYNKFLEILTPIKDKIYVMNPQGISSFCLQFIFKENSDKIKLQNALKKLDIEYRPIIGGNLLSQPCFSQYGKACDYTNAEIVHQNGFYIGNNQFVDDKRLQMLKSTIEEVFVGASD